MHKTVMINRIFISFSAVQICELSYIHLYAATNTITNCIKDIQRWMTCSKLKMNDGKTKFMIIGMRQQLSKQSINHLTVGTSSIEPSSSVRNLGTIFDTNLSLDKQIATTCKSSFYYLNYFRKIRKFLSPNSCATLVNAFITCRIDYCNSLSYGLPVYQIAKLQCLQNAAAPLVSLTPCFSHITPVLADLHLLPVRFRMRFKILIFVFRANHGLPPSYLSDLISIRKQSSYNLRSNKELLLVLPPVSFRLTLGGRTFSYAMVEEWNSLPSSIRHITSLATFKEHLQTYFYRKAFL